MSRKIGSGLCWTLAAALCAALLPAVAQARELTILTPELPPMMTADGKGREASIVSESLARCGHTAAFRVVPMGRHWIDFRDGGIGDAVTTVPLGMDMPGARSVPYILYQNGASVLKKSGLRISSLADLKGMRVISFVGAVDVLPGLREAIPQFSDFRERADQIIHSNLLFAERVDAVLADGLIFAEHNRQLMEKIKNGGSLSFDPRQEVVFMAIFPPTPYALMFRDPAVRDDFNRCFGELDASGRIAKINRDAVAPYISTVGNQYLHE